MRQFTMQGLSKRDWYDAYYDGLIEQGEGFDEDSQEPVMIVDYWDFSISKNEKGYIEDASDDWYIDLMKSHRDT